MAAPVTASLRHGFLRRDQPPTRRSVQQIRASVTFRSVRSPLPDRRPWLRDTSIRQEDSDQQQIWPGSLGALASDAEAAPAAPGARAVITVSSTTASTRRMCDMLCPFLQVMGIL